MNTLAGLKAGILCSGMVMVVFFEILRAVLANLDDEAAEATEIDVFAMSQRILNDFHELFDSVEHIGAVDTGRL